MGRRVRAVMPQAGRTGRLRFTAVHVGGHRLERIELVMRLQTVEVLLEDRPEGLVDRDALRLWMARPLEPLVFDEVRLEVDAEGSWLVMIRGREYPLPAPIEEALRREA